MKKVIIQRSCIMALVVAGILVITGSALAEKPPWAGGEKGGKHEQKKKHNKKRDSNADYSHDRHRSDVTVNIYFGDQHRNVIRNYYREQYRSGHCPPGLAKKKNGCMPPGQARKWQKGRQLPRNVIFHDLPPAVVLQLGSPPAGHRYVRVASDILLITAGTGMIVDAILDLNQIR